MRPFSLSKNDFVLSDFNYLLNDYAELCIIENERNFIDARFLM